MLRYAWLGGLAVGLGLTTGCLYHTTTGSSDPAAPPPQTVVPPPAAVADAGPVARPESVRGALAAPEAPEPPAKVRAKGESSVEMGPASPLLPPLIPPPPPAAPAPATPPPERPLVELLSLLEKEPEKASRELKRLDPAHRERVLALLKLTARASQGGIEKLPAEEAACLLEQLRHVCKELCRRAPLQLRKVAFCRSVKGFGQYEPAGASPQFRAGEDGQPGERVQVYAEVHHFRSRPCRAGHETKLDASLEVLDAGGKRVARVPLGTCSDCSQSPRHDYFLNCQFHVPAGLKPGKYTLRLKVRDLAPGDGPRQARAALELRVAAPRGS